MLVNYALGIVCILIGLVLLIWPRIARRAHEPGLTRRPNRIARLPARLISRA